MREAKGRDLEEAWARLLVMSVGAETDAGLSGRPHAWAPSWACTSPACRTSLASSSSCGSLGWWASQASWSPSVWSSSAAPV